MRTMNLWTGAALLVCAAMTSSCGTTAGPYEACSDGDDCEEGLFCTPSTLPASAGFTGELCTSGCTFDDDCLQLLDNYDAICVNDQCYVSCPVSDFSCPYGTGCVAFSDQNGDEIDICTP